MVDYDFTSMILVIPDKSDIERDEVAKVWEEKGGRVIRIARFWEPRLHGRAVKLMRNDQPPELDREKIRLYGNHIFCMILAQKLKLELISPPDDLLMSLSDNWLKREVRLSNIAEGEKLCYPCFIKPLAPKIFTARKYSSYEDLLEECKQLDNGTPVVYSDIVEINSEVRLFLLNGQVYTASLYEGEADIKDAIDFINGFISENRDIIPLTCVIDIGYILERGWAIIEANAVWGAGLNGCDPLAVAMCISEATRVEGDFK